jgi:protein involved in polysaccharide export with SLBB domain
LQSLQWPDNCRARIRPRSDFPGARIESSLTVQVGGVPAGSLVSPSEQRVVRPVWFVVLAFILVGPDGALAQSPSGSASSSRDTTDILRAGDVIRLRIWREPDLSGDYSVDETGVVVFPKIGAYTVRHESPETLKARLLSAYQVYLRNPSIDVMLLRRVNILGAVRNPGLYPVDATMTVADAVALAGGTTPDGHPDKVRLVRDGQRLTVKLSRRTKIIESPIRSGDQIYVPERSWISRNAGLVVGGAISASVTLLVALLTR